MHRKHLLPVLPGIGSLRHEDEQSFLSVHDLQVLDHKHPVQRDGGNSFSSDRGRPCLLFPSPESVNLDGKNEKGNLGDDAALQAMRYLLEVYP